MVLDINFIHSGHYCHAVVLAEKKSNEASFSGAFPRLKKVRELESFKVWTFEPIVLVAIQKSTAIRRSTIVVFPISFQIFHILDKVGFFDGSSRGYVF